MNMETLLNSDILKLFVILLAIVAIVFMFLKYRKDDGQRKIHIYYISGLCVFIILELVTYVCVNNDNATDIVSYISFASTLSSLLLSVVAIIYAIVSNNKGDAQYQKIDRASDRISMSVDRFSSISESLSGNINSILTKLDEIKVISNETKNAITNVGSSQTRIDSETSNLDVENLVKGFIAGGSVSGNISLLACVYSSEQRMPYNLTLLFGNNAAYCYGYIVASSALGIITARLNNDVIIVDRYLPIIKTILQDQIEKMINGFPDNDRKNLRNQYELIKNYFKIKDEKQKGE